MAPAAVRLQQEETHIMPLLLLQEPGAEVAGLTDLGAAVMGGTAVAAAAAREEQRVAAAHQLASSSQAAVEVPGAALHSALPAVCVTAASQSAAADGDTAVEEQ